MIRNIPNKFTRKMMLQALDQNFKDKYDFFYLPIDLKVGYLLLRITATWDLLLLTYFHLSTFSLFVNSLMAKSGNFVPSVRKSAKSSTHEFKEEKNQRDTLKVQGL